MADDDGAADEGEEDEDGGGGKKKIVMAVVGLAALGGVYQFVLKPAPPPEDLAAVTEPVEEAPVEGEIVELEEMILNIGGETDGFLRVGLAIVLDELTPAAEFELESAIAKDVAVQYLSSLDKQQLRSDTGRIKAKDELTVLIREAYGEEKVVRVLFTALVMQ